MSCVASHGAPYQLGGNALRIEVQTGTASGRKSKDSAQTAKKPAAAAAAAVTGAAAAAPPSSQPFRLATYFGAFDPVRPSSHQINRFCLLKASRPADPRESHPSGSRRMSTIQH